MKIKLFFPIYIIFFSFFLNSCQTQQSASEKIKGNDCISPPVNWYYPVMETLPSNFNYKKELIYPGNDWQNVTEIPEGYLEIDQMIGSSILDEIWFYGFNNTTGSDAFLQFHIDNKSWNIYDAKGLNQKELVNRIVTIDDGSIWIINNPQNGKISLISFDNGNSQFNKLTITGLPTTSQYPLQIMDVEYQSGLFWIILNGDDGDSLYSLDAKTYQAKRNLLGDPQPKIIEELTKDKNGNLWMIGKFQDGPDKLIKYSPTTKSITFYDFNRNQNGRDFLYFDNFEHLWVGGNEWIDFSSPDGPKYNRIIPSPVFIVDGLRPEQRYAWVNPGEMYQSSDGMYWFTSLVGMVSLNPNDGKWCLFTNGISSVFEDGNNSLWIVVGNKLYKRPIGSGTKH